MPIIRRAQIFTFKEVIVTDSTGFITDSVGTYTLDDPSTNPNGTGDFLGIIKSVALLGEVEIHTVDTRNLSIAQFNNLTQQEFDNYVRNTTIGYTRETIGWVEMGRTNASFYYETCSGGKRPVSEHYYNLEDFAFDNKRVYGEGPNILPSNATAIGGPNTALTPIGDFDPNWYTNIGPIGPRFEPLTLPAYMYGVIFNEGKITNSDGEIREVRGFYSREPSTWQPAKNGNRPIRKNILFANKSEHFDNKFVTEISPGKWGAVRGTIQQAVIPPTIGGRVSGQPVNSVPISMNFDVSKGECLKTITVLPPGGTTTTITTIAGPPPVIPPVMPPPVIVQNDNVRDLFVNPSLDELQSFKMNLLKKIKDLGFIYDENLRTLSTDESFAYIIPDIKKYPEILQLYHCYQINRNRLINESKADDFVEKITLNYSKGGISDSDVGLNSLDTNMGV